MTTRSEIFDGIKGAIEADGGTLRHFSGQPGGWTTVERHGAVYLYDLLIVATQRAIEASGELWGPKGSIGQGKERDYTPEQVAAILDELRAMSEGHRAHINFQKAGITDQAIGAAEKVLIFQE